jgi:hypothetical protein
VTTALVITVTKEHGYVALALVPEAVAAGAWCMTYQTLKENENVTILLIFKSSH